MGLKSLTNLPGAIGKRKVEFRRREAREKSKGASHTLTCPSSASEQIKEQAYSHYFITRSMADCHYPGCHGRFSFVPRVDCHKSST